MALVLFPAVCAILLTCVSAEYFVYEEEGLHRLLPNQTLCTQFLQPEGYPCTEHTVQTEDGFLLTLQRVASRHGELKRQTGRPVLLIHGLFMGGDAWFLNSPEQSLGFILADEGFDVWIGNCRGTLWSGGHVSFSPKDKEFWDWSWQDLAEYDVAKMLKFIQSTTGSKVLVVGHSQGTIISLAALTQQRLSQSVYAAAFLCPISYLSHVTAPLVLRMVDVHLDQLVLSMGFHHLDFRSEILVNLLVSMCQKESGCGDLLTSITGKNCCFNNSRVSHYLEYEPHPSSVKNIRHLFQMIRKGTFAKYDYGLLSNLVVYGQPKPPAFDLGLIPKTVPLWMGYGGHDSLADIADVEMLLKELSGKPQMLFLEDYGHVDFIVSTQGNEDVYKHLVSFFRSLESYSSSL